MALQTVGSVAWTDQPGSPQHAESPEGVQTVRRTIVSEGVANEAALKTQLDSYTYGDDDATWTDCTLESRTGTLNGPQGVINLVYKGGLSDPGDGSYGFVELQSSPDLRQKKDGTWTVPRVFIGPFTSMDGFINSKNIGTPDSEYSGAFLQQKGGKRTGFCLATVTLNYEGIIDDGDASGADRQFTREYREDSFTFQPWSKGGFEVGPQVTGFTVRRQFP